jgi:hypothetical protein
VTARGAWRALALAGALACGGGGGRPDYPVPPDDDGTGRPRSSARETVRTIPPRRAVSRAELDALLGLAEAGINEIIGLQQEMVRQPPAPR